MADRGFSPDYSESTEIGRIMVSGAITEPQQLITKEYMEANAVAGPKGDPGIPGIPGTPGTPGTDGADGGSAVIQGSATAAAIIAKPHVVAHMWISTTTGTDSDGHAIAVGDGVVSDGAKWLTVGQIQGPKGDPGIPGTNAPSSHPLLTDRGAADAHPYTAITDVDRVFTDRLGGYTVGGRFEHYTGNVGVVTRTSEYYIEDGNPGTYPPGFNSAIGALLETKMLAGSYGIQTITQGAVKWHRDMNPAGNTPWVQISANYQIEKITQAAYTALATKDPKTIYLIVG